jgi:O-succinylbenzoic acid--CoA ligase
VTTAGAQPNLLRTVDHDETPAALADALAGGPVVAPLPSDPIERSRALRMLQPAEPVDEVDAAVIVTTSGSTGAAKGVVLSRAAIRSSAQATHERLGGPGDWVLALPTHYVAGLMVLARAIVGGTAAISVRRDLLDLPAVADRVRRRRYLSLVPTQLSRALDQPDISRALARFDAVLIGGGPADSALLERAGARAITVVTTYGLSESCGGCVYDGVPLAGTRVELEAPGGPSEGRIMINTTSAFSGYRRQPELTASTLSDGWLRTEDRGRWQGDRLVVLGRLDQVVITGGRKVDLAEVERQVDQWAATRGGEGFVVALPDPDWGTTIAAASTTSGSLDELHDHLRNRVPAYALPRTLTRLERLPRLSSGKPDRIAVRNLIMNDRAAQVTP